jgi:hypothetical protein
MQSDKRSPRLEERTTTEQLEVINNPPPPTPTQEEADILKSGETNAQRETREKQERDMKPAASTEPYKTR